MMAFRRGLLIICCVCVAIFSACNPGNVDKDERNVSRSESDEICIDGVCDVPEYDDGGNQIYSIVSPVGYHDVAMIEQAPRLDTLEGKTIALVGGSFMASVTHEEIIKCIKEEYPTAKIYSFYEVGSGGPYSVFGQSQQTKDFLSDMEHKDKGFKLRLFTALRKSSVNGWGYKDIPAFAGEED